MNTPHFSTPSRPRSSSGFTLIELLIVISIILILAGMTLGAFRFANIKAARDKTRAQLKAIELMLERYSLEYGGYPLPNAVDPPAAFTLGTTTTGNGSGVEEHGPSNLNSAGAQMLYILMTGDTDLNGVFDANDDPILPSQSSGVGAFNEDKFGMVELSGGATDQGVLVDGFGNPFMYSVVLDDDDPVTPPNPRESVAGHTQRNGTYDLWSVADDEDNGTGTSTDQKWITNW